MSDVIEILQRIEKHPGMYFGDGDRSRSIRVLQAFLVGCQMVHQFPDLANFLDCFREWVATHYRILADNRGGLDIVLEHVGGDEQKAFDEFFQLLPHYLKDREGIGWNGIQLRFSEVQDELMNAFENEAESQ